MAVKVLIANRGEIACRVAKTLRELGLASVAVYSDADAEAPHVHLCDEAVCLGDVRSYLDMERVVQAARDSGATALHPGYGFLSENPALPEACLAAGITFIGPSAKAIRQLGDKRLARQMAESCGVTTIPGAATCDDLAAARRAAERLGFPLLIKAALGGGGRGMRRVDDASALAEAYAAAQREAKTAFHVDHVLLEKLLAPVRHIEVQFLGDGNDAVVLGERECSLQRRHQKILEEGPAASISEATRVELHAAALRLVRAANYAGAGTVEFLVDTKGRAYFLEVNTRLQVEHPVTEMLTGVDLVRAQIEIALGGSLPRVPPPRGHAIEVRLNAEDSYNGFVPATGRVLALCWPSWPHVRVDAGIHEGAEISTHYDILLAKIIAWGQDREQARRRLCAALRETTLLGVTTNQAFLLDVLERDFFVRGETYTSTIETERWSAPPVPAEALALALRELERPAAHVAAAGRGDHFSPWARLGRFRVGP